MKYSKRLHNSDEFSKRLIDPDDFDFSFLEELN